MNFYETCQFVTIIYLLGCVSVNGKRESAVEKTKRIASERFKECCKTSGVSEECRKICEYDLNPNYAMSYFHKFCEADVQKYFECANSKMDNEDCCAMSYFHKFCGADVQKYFECANSKMDNEDCCVFFGNINEECCEKYLGFGPNVEDASDLLHQCHNIFPAIMTCALKWFGG
uniref:Uncharacterized protein n=1 Tax=Panagrolaimus sp. JU765 TaxID=591449 RepID=A0AC34QRK9_9BILA